MTSMTAPRTCFKLILAVCILSGTATLLQLLAVIMMSFTEVPRAYEHFNAQITATTDLRQLKAACLALTVSTKVSARGAFS